MKPDRAGSLMSHEFISLQSEMNIKSAIVSVRQQISEIQHSFYYVYVLDAQKHLLGLVSFRELLSSAAVKHVSEIMIPAVTKVSENTSREDIAKIFRETQYLALPVVDSAQRLQGLVAMKDVVDVVQEKATQDIQRSGGTEALEGPYLSVKFLSMFKKRVGWLAVLFVSEMFTATAMQQVGLAVCLSLVSIVLWGSLIGSMLPLLLRTMRLDPAVACAPFVATIVDVSGLVIYFSTARLVLAGTVL